MTEQGNKTKMLVEGGIMIALAYFLNTLKLYRAPQGGSITPGAMVPIVLYGLRWGVGPGMFAGAAYGFLKMVLGGYVISPVQGILDYPLAYACLGLAGIFRKSILDSDKEYVKLVLAVFISVLARIICHVLSGILFFGKYAAEAGRSAIVHSLIVNSMLFIEMGITALVLVLIWKPLKRANI